jgi:hypothetical protein
MNRAKVNNYRELIVYKLYCRNKKYYRVSSNSIIKDNKVKGVYEVFKDKIFSDKRGIEEIFNCFGNVRGMAKHYNISIYYVRKLFKELGFKPLVKRKRCCSVMNNIKDTGRTFSNIYNSFNGNAGEIADYLGVSLSSVYKIFKELNLSKRASYA